MSKKSNTSDIILVGKVKEGDSSAFRELIEKYKDVSFSLACSIMKDEHDAEDALQDAFIKAYRNIHKFRGKSSFTTWIYRIVVNTCYTQHQKKHQHPFNEWAKDNQNDENEPETGHENLVFSDRKKMIHAAFKRMKPDEALLLQLYYLSERSIQEIKQITGYGESKIKVTLHRGRISLHDYLEKMLGHELKNIL